MVLLGITHTDGDREIDWLYKIIELQSTESSVFFSEYYPQTIEFT